MYYRQISGNGQQFGFPFGSNYTLAFSRMLMGREVLVAYNVSVASRSDSVVVDGDLHQPGDLLTYLYPKGKGTIVVQQAADGTRFVVLNLDGHQFAILE